MSAHRHGSSPPDPPAAESPSSQPGLTPDDRRTHPRIAAAFKVSYQSLDELVSAYSRDISEGGLFLPTRSFLPMGAVVQLTVELPEAGPKLETSARVAYVLDEAQAREAKREPGMGIEFLDVEGKGLAEQIADYLIRTSEAPQVAAQKAIPARVLVVDDNDLYREKAAAAMRKAGHRVTLAHSGVAALGMALRDPPDLIITDVRMPTMDGWQLLRLIRARPNLATTPVVFLTRLTSDEERLRGYQLGVDDYVAKPFTDAELIVRVQRVLDRSRAQRHANDRALRGDLSQVSLASLLSLAEMERRTGHLLVVHDEDVASLLLREGSVVRIDLGEQQAQQPPLERFFTVLSWTYGQFELSAAEVAEEDSVGLPISFVLLEFARRNDEGGRG